MSQFRDDKGGKGRDRQDPLLCTYNNASSTSPILPFPSAKTLRAELEEERARANTAEVKATEERKRCHKLQGEEKQRLEEEDVCACFEFFILLSLCRFMPACRTTVITLIDANACARAPACLCLCQCKGSFWSACP